MARATSRSPAREPTDGYARHFRDLRKNYDVAMQRMFAAVSELYGAHWNEFFHFAIFEHEGESWDEAFARTHARYLEAVRVDQASRVLELACGRGRFTRLLSERCPGDVLGVDISGAQLARARAYEADGLRLQFRQHDIMRIDELADRFDAAVYLDAACYLPDKRRALAKIRKVLEPGARFLLVDWCKREGLTPVQEELVLHPLMRDWAIPSLETPERYQRHLGKAGFRILEVDDLNDRVQPNWELGYERALAAVQEVTARDLPRLIWKGLRLGADGIRLMKAQFGAALYIKAGFDAGFLRYVLFLAEAR